MDSEVPAALNQIEQEEGIRILHACESGSRAWGFASPDSDFDGRFIYVHPQDWYLSIQAKRDVIERMLPGDLDLSGWELRKGLQLLAKSNATLMEWLGSPIVYGGNAEFVADMQALVPSCFNAIRVHHHYLSTARKTLASHLADNAIGIKKLFYVLRPLLACRWVRETGTMPPTEFSGLYAADRVSVDERTMIQELLTRKAVANEGEVIGLTSQISIWLDAEINAAQQGIASLKNHASPSMKDLNACLQKWIAGTR